MSLQDPDTRQKILKAAEELFSQKGFEGASIRDIAAQAGVNKSLVHYHFKSKSDVLVELANGFLEEALAEMMDFRELSDFQNPSVLVKFLEERMDYLIEHKNFLNILIIEALKTDPEHHFIFDLIRSLIETILGKNQASGIQNANFSLFLTRFFFFTLTPMLIFAVMGDKLAAHFKLPFPQMKNSFQDTMIQMFMYRLQDDFTGGGQ